MSGSVRRLPLHDISSWLRSPYNQNQQRSSTRLSGPALVAAAAILSRKRLPSAASVPFQVSGGRHLMTLPCPHRGSSPLCHRVSPWARPRSPTTHHRPVLEGVPLPASACRRAAAGRRGSCCSPCTRPQHGSRSPSLKDITPRNILGQHQGTTQLSKTSQKVSTLMLSDMTVLGGHSA